VYLNKNYGEPVKGSKEQYFYGFTNADGKIVFADVTEGDYNYDVYYGEVWDYSSVTINQNMQIDVVLVPPPSYTITFDVSDITTSLPIEGAEISLYVGVKKPDGLKEYYNEIRTTIADGTAVFEGVPEGNYYYYDVFHANYFSSGDMLIVDADKIVAVQLEPATKSKK
jgi:hypothetical protein